MIFKNILWQLLHGIVTAVVSAFTIYWAGITSPEEITLRGIVVALTVAVVSAVKKLFTGGWTA